MIKRAELNLASEPSSAGRVSVEQVSNLFAEAGVPRSPRTIRRYCQRGVLTCTRIDTDNNQEQYLIERESIDRRIDELRQVYAGLEGVRSEPAMSGLDRPRPDMASRTSEFGRDLIDVLKEQMHEKDRQLGVKDQQISALNRTLDSQIERDRETNVLIKGLQEQVFRLQAPADKEPRVPGHGQPPASHVATTETGPDQSEQGITE